MDRNELACFAVLSIMFSPAVSAETRPAIRPAQPALDAVIDANILARGGRAALESVRTEKLRGHITFADGVAHRLTSDLARPDRIRTELFFNGTPVVQTYDGRVGWAINSFQQKNSIPYFLPTGEAQNVAAGGDMDGPLVDYAKKGNRVTLAGIDTAAGRPAYKLNVTTAAGLNDTYYIDTVSHLQTKWSGHRVSGGQPVVYESFFSDYRAVSGVMIAFRIDSDTQGQPGSQHIVLDTVVLNDTIADDEFMMPGGPAHGPVMLDSLYSPALGVLKHLVVYLPPSYAENPTRRYPVAYYLHGTGGNERSWVIGIAIDSVLDSLAAAGTPAMIVVMPDGDNGYYHNWKKSPNYESCLKSRAIMMNGELPTDFCVHQMRYGDYMAHDLVSHVDSAYRTIADPEHRGVGGLSMGGYGAVYLPLEYPDVFSAGASLSGAGLALMRLGGYPDTAPAREATTMEQLHAQWSSTWNETTDEIGTSMEDWRAVDPVSMVRRAVASHRKIPHFWLIVGTEDESTLTVNRVFHQALVRLGVPHTYIEAPGGHTTQFWRAHEGASLAWMASEIAPH